MNTYVEWMAQLYDWIKKNILSSTSYYFKVENKLYTVVYRYWLIINVHELLN